MKLKSIKNSKSIMIEIKEQEIEELIKSFELLVVEKKNLIILNCQITINSFSNYKRNQLQLVVNNNQVSDCIYIEDSIITLSIERDTLDYTIELIENIISKKIPNMIEITEITFKKWKQSSYLILHIISQ